MKTSTTKTVIWIHGDNLNPQSVVFDEAPDAPAIFVWDDALLAQWRLSLKRVVFMYECLLEMPVVIRRGDVGAEVAAFALEHGAGRIITTRSPSPRFRATCKRVAAAMPSGSRLEVLRETPFVDYEGYLDLKRYSRYWNKVKKIAMQSG
ncbi:MAG: hypothetical protein OHK0046_06970 [Anaerolineae bacterium]